MLKRIFSLLIIITMLFSVTAFASDEEVVVLPDSGNMEFAKALGIIDKGTIGTDDVTRLDLAKMFCAVMRTDIGLATNQYVTFTDVPAEASSVVANISQAGIMNGVGGGLFAPEAPVTYIQAIKAMVTFLGYAENAEDKGGYPYGYYVQAIQLGLDDNAPADMNSEITYEKAAELFKLAVNADYRKPINFKPDTQYEVVDNLTYLGFHRNIKRVRGIIKSNSTADITGDGKTKYNEVRIDSTIYTYNVGAMDISSLFAHTVDAYYDADTKEICFAEPVGNNTVIIDDSEIEGLNGDYIEYYKGSGKKQKIKINEETFVLYNGAVCGNYGAGEINPFTGSNKDGNITAIDNDGNGVYDVILVDAYDTYVVSSVRDTKIFTEYRGGAVLDISDYDEEKAPLLYNVIGQPIKISEVQPGNTLSVSKTRVEDGADITKIVVTVDTCIGNIEAISNRGGKMYITMGNQTFEASNSLALNPQVANLSVGARTRLMFNKDALVSDIEQEEFDSWITAYLTGYQKTPGLDSTNLIRVFGADSKWTVYELAEKISINEATPVDASTFPSEAGMEGEKIKRQPIVFKLDGNGKVKDIHLQRTTNKTDPLYMYEGFDGTETSKMEINSDYSFGGKLLISDSSTVIFSVPTEANRNNENEYFIRNVSIFDKTTRSFWAYGTSESPMAAIVVIEDAFPTMQPAQNIFLVDFVETFIDEDGDIAYRLAGYFGKTYVEYIDKKDKLFVGPGGTLPEKGDILRVTVIDKQPDIVEFVFDESDRKIYTVDENGIVSNANPSAIAFDTAKRFSYGKVMRTDNDTFTYRLENNGSPIIEHYPKKPFAVLKVNTQGKELVVSLASAEELIGENDYPGTGSTIFMHTYTDGRSRSIVIYED